MSKAELHASKIGVVAGKGGLPVTLVSEIRKTGETPVVIALDRENAEALGTAAGTSVHSYSVTQIGGIVKCLKENHVGRLVFAGKVEKSLIFQKLAFDLTAAMLLKRLINRNDETVMLEILNFLEKEKGFTVLKQTDYLSSFLLQKGTIVGKAPTKEEEAEIEYGFAMAKGIADLGIGQTIVVKNKAVIAVEAIEGTDRTILRAGEIMKEGCSVIKVCKRNQDLRFDIPTVGVTTLESMKKGDMRLLVVEAGKTFCPQIEEVTAFAKRNGIKIVAW